MLLIAGSDSRGITVLISYRDYVANTNTIVCSEFIALDNNFDIVQYNKFTINKIIKI